MIIDTINHLSFYEPMLPKLKNAIATMEAHPDHAEGENYSFDGGYLKFQKGETKPIMEGTFEAHRKYVDVQIVLEGAEEMCYEPLEKLTSVIPYDENKDAERFEGNRNHRMLIEEGMFYVAFPKDGHKSISHSGDKPHSFVKCIIKLEVKEKE